MSYINTQTYNRPYKMLKVISARGKNKAPRTKTGVEEGYNFHKVVRASPEGDSGAKAKSR